MTLVIFVTVARKKKKRDAEEEWEAERQSKMKRDPRNVFTFQIARGSEPIFYATATVHPTIILADEASRCSRSRQISPAEQNDRRVRLNANAFIFRSSGRSLFCPIPFLFVLLSQWTPVFWLINVDYGLYGSRDCQRATRPLRWFTVELYL